jgi:hypothetical protein
LLNYFFNVGIDNDGRGSGRFVFDPEITVGLIHQLPKDLVVANMIDHSSEFYLMEDAIWRVSHFSFVLLASHSCLN